MKRLYVLRHAKSSWASPGQQDFDRQLSARGLTQCQLLRDWLTDDGNTPELVLCSPSKRTIETYEQVGNPLSDASFEVVDRFYHGSLETYLETIWSTDDSLHSVMLIGHNPTCDELSRYIAKASSSDFEKLMSHHFGTANLAVFDFEGSSWSQIGQGNTPITKLVRPKDIERAG